MQQHKYYRNPEISLTSLSRHIGTNRSYLSLTISYGYGCNFCTYINRLRIKELVGYGGSVLQSDDSFYDAALACGFNSRRTFYRAFLREKGILPTDFVTQYKMITLHGKNQQQ